MSIFITLFALGVVIFIHELGHMLAAKKAGVGVYEFAIGMGPKIIGKEINGTLYSLRAFPFGGFVKLAGMDDEKGKSVPKEIDFRQKSIWNRFVILSGGAGMNILLGFVTFVIIYSCIGVPSPTQTIELVMPDMPASQAGLKAGDQVLAINGDAVTNTEDDIIKKIQQAAGVTLQLTIKRKSLTQQIDITPKVTKQSRNRGIIGVQFQTETIRYNPIKSVVLGADKTLLSIKQVFWSFGLLIKGHAIWKDLAGPIGIVQFASFELGRGILNFLNIMAVISISLGVINLFPIPVLDGGHLLFLAYEAITRKTLNPKIESGLMYTGGLFLISLFAVIIINDVVNFQSRIDFLKNLGL